MLRSGKRGRGEGQQLTIMAYRNHVIQIHNWPYDLRHKKDH